MRMRPPQSGHSVTSMANTRQQLAPGQPMGTGLVGRLGLHLGLVCAEYIFIILLFQYSISQHHGFIRHESSPNFHALHYITYI
jgi:hypothetical protein